MSGPGDEIKAIEGLSVEKQKALAEIITLANSGKDPAGHNGNIIIQDIRNEQTALEFNRASPHPSEKLDIISLSMQTAMDIASAAANIKLRDTTNMARQLDILMKGQPEEKLAEMHETLKALKAPEDDKQQNVSRLALDIAPAMEALFDPPSQKTDMPDARATSVSMKKPLR